MSLDVCVLAGGRGERFWPLSRRERPKQLTDLTGRGTMLRLTVERVLPRTSADRVVVVTSDDLTPAVREELPELPAGNVVGEPVGKNSAPAIALAAHWTETLHPGATMLVAPSDHVIDREAFLPALDEAASYAAANDVLLTFGIRPTRPDTGYGYIEPGAPLSGEVREARAFHEKPERDVAERFVAEGHLWNSGLFVWRASVLLAALEAYAPEVHASLDELEMAEPGRYTQESLRAYYERTPSISIDYAVMERAPNVAVRASDFPWCDVGAWSALGEVLGSDPAGNVAHGRVFAKETERCVLYTDGAPIAAVGVKDVVVVNVRGVTMVCAREEAGRVRDLVRALGEDPAWRDHL